MFAEYQKRHFYEGKRELSGIVKDQQAIDEKH